MKSIQLLELLLMSQEHINQIYNDITPKGIDHWLVLGRKTEELNQQIKRRFYSGKPTRKFNKYFLTPLLPCAFEYLTKGN